MTAERAMVNQVQVLVCVLLVLIVAGGVKLGNDISQKCPVDANPGPVAHERPRVDVLAQRRVARAHQR